MIAWGNCNLSFVSKILIANQVLLSSMWYMATCQNPNPRICNQIRGVIWNFIWGGKAIKTRVKVKWDSLTLPFSNGAQESSTPKFRSSCYPLFIQQLNLNNLTNRQVLAIIWHNSCPRKVGIFIWLTLNCELPVGTWLQCMRIPPTCKVYPDGLYELWQHCLLECVKAKYAWEAYFRVWQKWGALDDIALSWPLILLGDLVVEKEDDPPKIQNYHAGGFSFITQPLDILRSFIFYFLWSKRCRMHFDVQYSSHNVLQQAWVVIVGLG